MTKSTLQQQLETLSAARYPLHMPGHKRRVPPAPGLGCYAWDLTEIDGADDLHDADGILADAMARTAALYGARRCWYLVGGSTVGLLAGIRALAPFGSTVIAARNCHKAVYHAIELGQLTARWLTPPVDPQFGIYGSVRPADVAAALDAAPDARCVILTSPTYEGVLSDIRTIAEICHARGVPLLVDEAHGAHYLPFAARYGWRGGAVAAGADLVVQSAHKTLPSLTQTAFLQLNGNLADPAGVERQLDVFETSSPSYPLMVSLDGCTRWLADEGEAAFAAWRARLDAFDAAVRDLKNTKILCCGADALTAHPDFFAHDSGKILLQIGAAGAAYLRADGFEPEMVCGPNVLAMTSPCDDADALERLADVLHAWDKTAAPPAAPRHILPAPGAARCTIAEALLRVVIRHGEAVVKNPGDIDAMSEIMWAGSLSHNNLTGLGGKKDFSVHQFGQAIGEKFDIYHGETLSAMWASYARYVAPTNFARFARYARNVWGVEEADDEKAAMAGIDATEAYFKRLGMPVRIAELSCGVQDEAGLYDLALRCSRNRGRTIGTFRVLDFEGMLNVYQMANK